LTGAKSQTYAHRQFDLKAGSGWGTAGSLNLPACVPDEAARDGKSEAGMRRPFSRLCSPPAPVFPHSCLDVASLQSSSIPILWLRCLPGLGVSFQESRPHCGYRMTHFRVWELSSSVTRSVPNSNRFN